MTRVEAHGPYLLMFGQPGFVMDVGGDQIKILSFRQDPQQQHDSATPTLSDPVIDNLAWEWQDLNQEEKAKPVN